LVDDPVPPPVPPEAGAVVAVVPVEPPRAGPLVAVLPVAAVVSVVAEESVPPPLVSVVEPVSEPAPAVVDVAALPEDEDAPFPDVVVAALAGLPFFAPDGDGLAANAGEIATRPTIPAASGNRNRRCMAASSVHLCIFANE
jgi:hypothetical protein